MKKLDGRTIISIILILLTIYTLGIFIKQEINIYHLGIVIKETQQEIDKESKKNKELTTEKEALSRMDYIEKVAREELGVTKPGEIPYIPSKK